MNSVDQIPVCRLHLTPKEEPLDIELLTRKVSGKISPKRMALLWRLAIEPGRVVPMDEVRRYIWKEEMTKGQESKMPVMSGPTRQAMSALVLGLGQHLQGYGWMVTQ